MKILCLFFFFFDAKMFSIAGLVFGRPQLYKVNPLENQWNLTMHVNVRLSNGDAVIRYACF